MDQELSLDSVAFRRLMSRFATGVAVLAVRQPNGSVVAMTANAITSVSLTPTLLLVCVEKIANFAPYLLSSDVFSICFLSEDRADLSDHFAGRQTGEPPRFEFKDWEGGPLLVGCLAALGCRRYDVLEGGDHWIVLGETLTLHKPETSPEPLIFYSSRYRRLVPMEISS